MMSNKLLIISANCISCNRNNGKTILSLINGIKKEYVHQIYFSNEYPDIEGYKYFQISDLDIIKRRLYRNSCGRIVNVVKYYSIKETTSKKIPLFIKRNCLTLILREFLWWRCWNSSTLDEWIDEFKPTSVLFIAGDAIFTYDICKYIVKKYNVKLTVFVTDDYILPQKRENFLDKIRKKIIIRQLTTILKISKNFYTISEKMRDTYKILLGFSSEVVYNITPSLKKKTYYKENCYYMIYTGSLYYGRAEVLNNIANAIKKFNDISQDKQGFLEIFSNDQPELAMKKILNIESASQYCGTLNTIESLERFLNRADILVYVESFEEEFIEKVKFSFSTKIPEYLSLGKPIIAVGPRGVNSIDYLSDVSFCINNACNIEEQIYNILSNFSIIEQLGVKAEKKYIEKCIRNNILFQNNLF